MSVSEPFEPADNFRKLNGFRYAILSKVNHRLLAKAVGLMTKCGVKTKSKIINLTPSERLRQKAVARAIASYGKFPGLLMNGDLEKPEKRHLQPHRAR